MNEPNTTPYDLTLQSVERAPERDGIDTVTFHTDRGAIDCRLHPTPDPQRAVVWVGGAGGGLTGPARGLYPRTAATLAGEGIASLRIDYRYPNEFIPCVLDTLLGAAYLQSLGCDRIVLVGHSFGGAVVIAAGANHPAVVSVVTLAGQSAYTEATPDLAPRSLLLIHGAADTVLPASVSRSIYKRANDPRKLIIYEGCGHGFDECIDRLDTDLLDWIRGVLAVQ